MNAEQLNVNLETGEEETENGNTPTHTYKWFNIMQIGQQSTIAKLHMHIMLNQMGIKE